MGRWRMEGAPMRWDLPGFLRWLRRGGTSSRRSTLGRRRGARPCLEAIEGRALLAAVLPHHAPRSHGRMVSISDSDPATRPRLNPLDRYRIFVGTITRGPEAG